MGEDEEFVSRGDAAQWLADSRHLLVFRREGLVSVDIQDDDATVLVRRTGLLRGWSESLDGTELAYALAKKESRSGECGEYVDIYVVDRDGGSRRRLTRDGRSSDPVWRDGRIAFAREPVKPPCAPPNAGIWTMASDGRDVHPVIRTAPRRFAWNGYYGLRPYGFVRRESLILAGVRTEWGDELALIDSRTKRIRRPDLDRRPRSRQSMYVDYVSRDGRHVLGAGCGAEFPCTIRIYSVLEHRARVLRTGRVGAHWNR